MVSYSQILLSLNELVALMKKDWGTKINTKTSEFTPAWDVSLRTRAIAVPSPAAPPQPSAKTEPLNAGRVSAMPKDGKYLFAYNDGTGWGMLLEKRGDVLWVSGDINPKKPGGLFVWPKPRPVSFQIKGQKIICDDRSPEYKWAFVFTWDLASGEATRQMDVADPSSVKRGTVRPGSW